MHNTSRARLLFAALFSFLLIVLPGGAHAELFAKLYHLSADKKNVYNVFFDREIYDATTNPYTVRMRFGWAF